MTATRFTLSRRAFAPAASALCLSLSACRSKGDRDTQAEPHDPSAAQGKPAALPAALERPDVAELEKWNFPGLPWRNKTSALARMEAAQKPGLVVIKGEWCPHCRKYARLFSDPDVAQLTANFELILLESDSGEAAQWQETGSYVPRTLFLDPQGQLDASFAGPNPRFPYFFSEDDKAQLISAMNRAKIKYRS